LSSVSSKGEETVCIDPSSFTTLSSIIKLKKLGASNLLKNKLTLGLILKKPIVESYTISKLSVKSWSSPAHLDPIQLIIL